MNLDPLVDTSVFRTVCGHFPTGVTAITACVAGGETAALTVNSFTSVSLDPPQVLFCLGSTSSSYTKITQSIRVAIHILASHQEEIARRLATSGLSGPEKLAGLSWVPGPDGVPLLVGTPAVLIGHVGEVVVSGDHAILLIDVDFVHLSPTATPALSFYRGRFASPVVAPGS